MKRLENKHRRYVPEESWLKFRRVLVDWMCEAGDEFQLHISTMHVAVMYLDRMLQSLQIPRHKLQLVAVACILIAAKFEEMEEVVPTISDMNRYAQRAFIPEEIQNTEVVVLNRLDWSLTTFTPLHFSSYFVSEGVLFHEDRMKGRELVDKVLKYVKRYIDFFADLCLQDYSFQKHSPSLMAAAIIMASRKALSIRPLWRSELAILTEFEQHEVAPCFDAIWKCYRKNFPNAPLPADEATSSPTGVEEMVDGSAHAMTSSSKYGSVDPVNLNSAVF